jgi:hypothetical protein
MLTINPFTVVTLLDIRKEKKKLGLQGDRRRRRGGGAGIVLLLLSSFLLLEMDNFSVCNIYR